MGVHPPLDEAKLATPAAAKAAVAAAGGGTSAIDVHAMEKQMLHRETKAAVLRIEIFKVSWGPEGQEERGIR